MGSAINSYRPAWSETVDRVMPVSTFVADTAAPETTAPVWSATRPDRAAETWAFAVRDQKKAKDNTTTPRRCVTDIFSPAIQSQSGMGGEAHARANWEHKIPSI